MATIPEAKWGIRDGSRAGAKTTPQRFAVIVGIVYVALGLIGFFVTASAGFVGASDTALLGLFHLNPFHNVIHLALGALTLFAGLVLTPAGTEGVLFFLGAFLVVAAVLGYLGYLHELMAVPAGLDADNWLHLVLGVVTLLFSNPLKALTG